MTEWDIQMKEAIAQYHMIFVKPGLYDRRMSCEMDQELFPCHGIDEIQLCVYCIANRESLRNELKWNFQKFGGDYYIFPSAGNSFQESITYLKELYSKCTLKYNYLENDCLTSIYKTCNGKVMPTKLHSCHPIVDMIFNMNRHGRNKTELDNLNALFCCMNLSIFQSLLLDAYDHIRTLRRSDKLIFLNEVVNLCEKVSSIRDYVNACNGTQPPAHKPEVILDELECSSAIIISLLRKNNAFQSMKPTFSQAFYKKLKDTLAEERDWRYNRRFGGNGSCQSIFHAIIKNVFPTASFNNTTVPIKEDIESARKLLNNEG